MFKLTPDTANTTYKNVLKTTNFSAVKNYAAVLKVNVPRLNANQRTELFTKALIHQAEELVIICYKSTLVNHHTIELRKLLDTINSFEHGKNFDACDALDYSFNSLMLIPNDEDALERYQRMMVTKLKRHKSPQAKELVQKHFDMLATKDDEKYTRLKELLRRHVTRQRKKSNEESLMYRQLKLHF